LLFAAALRATPHCRHSGTEGPHCQLPLLAPPPQTTLQRTLMATGKIHAIKRFLQNVKTLSSRDLASRPPSISMTSYSDSLYSLKSIMFPSKSTPLSTLGPLTSANRITRVTSTQVTAEDLRLITFSLLGAQTLVQSGCPFASASCKLTPYGHSPSEFTEAAHGRSCPLMQPKK